MPMQEPDPELERLMRELLVDEAQRDEVARSDPGLRTDVTELLALYRALHARLGERPQGPPPQTTQTPEPPDGADD